MRETVMQAYRAARVAVGPHRLAVGATALPAAGPLAVITAHNPQSRRRPDAANRAANALLAAQLRRAGARLLPSTNAPGTAWEEASFAVAGVPLATVVRVAQRFGQRAIYASVGGRWTVYPVD